MGVPFKLTAIASSGLPVTYTVQTPTTCRIDSSGTIQNIVSIAPTTFVNSIPCSVTAKQAGDSNWLPAADVTKSFSFTRARMAITASGTTSLVGAGPHTFNATLNPSTYSLRVGSTGKNQTLSAISLNPTICKVNGVTFDPTPSKLASIVSITGLKNGICSITLSSVGNLVEQDATQTIQRIFSGIK